MFYCSRLGDPEYSESYHADAILTLVSFSNPETISYQKAERLIM